MLVILQVKYRLRNKSGSTGQSGYKNSALDSPSSDDVLDSFSISSASHTDLEFLGFEAMGK